MQYVCLCYDQLFAFESAPSPLLPPQKQGTSGFPKATRMGLAWSTLTSSAKCACSLCDLGWLYIPCAFPFLLARIFYVSLGSHRPRASPPRFSPRLASSLLALAFRPQTLRVERSQYTEKLFQMFDSDRTGQIDLKARPGLLFSATIYSLLQAFSSLASGRGRPPPQLLLRLIIECVSGARQRGGLPSWAVERRGDPYSVPP